MDVSFSISPSSQAICITGSSISTTDMRGAALSARSFSRFTSDRVPSNTTRRPSCFSITGNTNSFM
jgi:hypothetical protein